MVVFSNHRLGPSAELLVSDEVAQAMLRAIANAARPFAEARWELELVLWLDARADVGPQVLDVSEIAWTPEHFEIQRSFLLHALDLAALTAEHAFAYDRLRGLIAVHPEHAVQVGRRWQWPSSVRDTPRDVVDGGERSETLGYLGTSDLSVGR